MALVINSWRKVQEIDNYKDVAGELLFRRYVLGLVVVDANRALGWS